MTPRRRHDLVLAIYLQTRGFAHVLFEGCNRALRIRNLNAAVGDIVEHCGITTRMYSRSEVREAFSHYYKRADQAGAAPPPFHAAHSFRDLISSRLLGGSSASEV
jgi:hypothetical protein